MAGRNSWKEFGERFLEMIPDGIPGRLMAMAMEEVGEGERERGGEKIKGDVRFQSARGHQFRDQHDVLPLHQDHFPIIVEAYDIRMLEAFQHFRFLPEALPLALVQLLLLFNLTKKRQKRLNINQKSPEERNRRHQCHQQRHL